MTPQTFDSGSTREYRWGARTPACNRAYMLAAMRAGLIAVVLLGVLALIVLF